MPKDRFPLYLWISVLSSLASGVATNLFNFWVGAAVWSISGLVTLVFMYADWRKPKQEVIYPSRGEPTTSVAPASKPKWKAIKLPPLMRPVDASKSDDLQHVFSSPADRGPDISPSP